MEPARVPTFHQDVAPVLFARCVTCHRPRGAAPFGLVTYDDARRRSRQIAEVTASRFMPPWLPEAGHERFRGERRLDEAEISLLAGWAAAGALEGDPNDATEAPSFPDGWQMGEPDLTIESPPFDLPADGPNRFRNIVLPAPIDEARWVKAVEIRPLSPRVTHHARLGIDSNNESVRRDAADADVGYEGMAWGQDPGGQLITWTPGMTADLGTAGAAWQLAPDEKLVLHTHLQPSGKPEQVCFRLGFYFAEAPPTLFPMIVRIGSRDIDVPAGAAKHRVEDSYELPVDVDAHFVFPHAHALCCEIVLEAHLPGGERKSLLAIHHFDQNWHDTYRFASPTRLPRGTKLVTRFTYDNTSENPANPHHPPRRVVFGSNVDDEMADVYLQVTPVDPAQSAVLTEDFSRAELSSKIVGYRKSLVVHPDDPWSAESLASCYVADGQPAEAVLLLEARPELLRDSIQVKLILGMAYLAQGDVDAAERWLRKSLEMDDRFSLAWLGLGQVLIAKLEVESAKEAYRRAIQLAPQMMLARLGLADLLIQQERLEEAESVCQNAIEIAPEEYKPRLKLANVLAQQKKYEESLEHFAAARKLAPFLYVPQASLAIACYQSGDETMADQLLQQAVDMDADDPVPHCFLGQIARRDGESSVARENLRLASELPTPLTWPESHRRQFLTLVYKEQLLLADELEDMELAREAATEWLRLEPDNRTLQELLRQMRPDDPEP